MLIDYYYLKNAWNIHPKGVIHVGAHVGQELHVYSRDTDIKKIIFFEVSPSIYSELKVNLDNFMKSKPMHLETILSYNFGLGSSEEDKELYLASNGESSSLLKPLLHLEKHSWVSFPRKEQVEIKTLDSFKIQDCDFMNIDVQGYELEVLKGARETLSHINWIYLEVNSDYLYENCALVSEIDDFLLAFNFKREETKWVDHCNWGDAFYRKIL